MPSATMRSPCFSSSRSTHAFRTTDSIDFCFNLPAIQNTLAKPVFSSLVTTGNVSLIQETAEVLDVILHVLHNSSCACLVPSIEVIGAALARMPLYGVTPSEHVRPKSPLYSLIASHAPFFPLAAFTLAAQFGLHELAVECSPYMLNVPVSDITDDATGRMGPIYIKKVLLMRTKYYRKLRDVAGKPPDPHPPLPHCETENQRNLLRDWIGMVGTLLLELAPDLSGMSQETRFMSLETELECEKCKDDLRVRVAAFRRDWAKTKISI